MEFAWVRFHKSKVETCLPISEIGLKEKLANGSLKINPFNPKDDKDFITTKWYFAKKNVDNGSKSENVWSRIVILYLGATRDEIDDKRKSDQRKKYPKCVQSESSFEETLKQASQSSAAQRGSQKKKACTERAKNVLKSIEANFVVSPFMDLEENNSVCSGTVAVQNPIVRLEKCKAADNKKSMNQTSPDSPSMLDKQRKRKNLVDQTKKSSRASRSRNKIPRCSSSESLSPRSSQSHSPQHTPPSARHSSEERTPDRRHSPLQTVLPQNNKQRYPLSPLRQLATPSPSPGRNSREGTPSHARNSPKGTPSPARNSPKGTPSPARNSPKGTPSPARNSPKGTPSSAINSPENAQSPARSSPDRGQPLNVLTDHEVSPAQNGEPQRAKRIKYYRMAEYIKHCIDYYTDKRETEPGFKEMQNRYTIRNGNEMYLGEGHYINLIQWELMQAHKPPIFLVELAIHLWGERELTNRALDLTRGVENIPTWSPVKLIEKEVLRLLISLYGDFLQRNNYPNDEKVSYLLRATYVLRHKIRDLRSAEKKKHRVQHVNLRRRLSVENRHQNR